MSGKGRLLSVALTESQVRDRSKTQTRRLGWWADKNGRRLVQAGDRLQLVRKAMGRQPGEPIVVIAAVQVVDVTREYLDQITPEDVAAEGFPDWTPAEFIKFFCREMRCYPGHLVTVIRWRYLDDGVHELAARLIARANAIDESIIAREPAGHAAADAAEQSSLDLRAAAWAVRRVDRLRSEVARLTERLSDSWYTDIGLRLDAAEADRIHWRARFTEAAARLNAANAEVRRLTDGIRAHRHHTLVADGAEPFDHESTLWALIEEATDD